MLSLTPIEKKRSRDRRAQNARRARQEACLRSLEEVANHCRQHHGEQYEENTRTLRSTIEALQVENAKLRSQHAAVISILTDPAASPLPMVDSVKLTTLNRVTKFPALAIQDHAHHGRPSQHLLDDPLVETLTPWLLYPAVALPLHDEPTGDDILYGSQTNPLANAIHVALICARFGTIAEVERLALGWLMYVQTKWVFDPTPAHFDRLPHFLRPTKLQQERAHSALIDIVVWPEIRDNLILCCKTPEELLDALRTLAPELKGNCLPRPPLLEPDSLRPGNLKIKEAFIKAFSDLDSWEAPSSFIERYPELVQGTHWSGAVDS